MKKSTSVLILLLSIFVSPLFSQQFVDLKKEESVEVNELLASYTVVKKGTKKGSDLYKLTISITNRGNDFLRIFNQAVPTFIKKPENAIAYFQFTNANGKAMSATSARFYPEPKYVKVPYKCKKCPPVQKDEDPYNHYTKSVIIGSQFLAGSSLSRTLNIRVPEGEIPTVRVMIY